jgi:uncharacterized membrane protein YeaQ/YmgE (transglycosylase-associated protein family)
VPALVCTCDTSLAPSAARHGASAGVFPEQHHRGPTLGAIVTMVIGIIGGLIGGWVGFGGLGSFSELRTWILAVAGSIVLLLIVRLATDDRRHRGPLPH